MNIFTNHILSKIISSHTLSKEVTHIVYYFKKKVNKKEAFS